MAYIIADETNLIVADAEYARQESSIQNEREVLDAAMEGYIEAIQFALDNGVKDTLIHNKLSSLVENATLLRMNLNNVLPNLSGLFQPYVDEIDEADNVLY